MRPEPDPMPGVPAPGTGDPVSAVVVAVLFVAWLACLGWAAWLLVVAP